MSIMPEYLIPKPSERNPENYLEAVKVYNMLIHLEAQEKVLAKIPELRDNNGRYTLITTGSDGRYEKSSLSPIELILLHFRKTEEAIKIKKKLEKLCKEEPEIFDLVSEVKDISTEKSCFYLNDKNRVFPTRPFDSLLICGNPTLQTQYKDNMSYELKGDEGKRNIKRFNNQKRSFRRILETGIEPQTKTPCFDLNGILHYDGKRIKSTKYAHLRAIQFKLATDVFREIAKGKFDVTQIDEMPRTTVERLNYYNAIPNLSNMGIFELDDLIHAYKKAIYWYHFSEEKFKEGIVDIEVDKNELTEVTNIAHQFASRDKSIFN